MFFNKRYSGTCMRRRRSCPPDCNSPADRCPEYTPDFVKLAESYGAKGYRVTSKEEIAPAFEAARKNTCGPTLIEFIIDPEEMVYPMVQPGGTLEEMIMDC